MIRVGCQFLINLYYFAKEKLSFAISSIRLTVFNPEDMQQVLMVFIWSLQRAIEEGTDFIETDILSTKDGALICFHDVTLDDTTDVANHKEFANRRRTYEVQGENVTGWFTGMQTMRFP